MSKYLLAAFLLASAMLAPGLYGQRRGQGNRDRNDDDQVRRTAAFRSQHRRIISEYYRGHPAELPPGLAMRGGDLPPGLARQLRRNGRLPPGLDRRFVPFPVELERRFAPLPPYYRRGFIGDRAVIYN